MTNPLELSGRTILVTGASSGIGRETAVLLSELGARVILAARNTERLNQTLALLTPGEHRVETLDVTELDEIAGWMKRVTAQTGPLSGLVHSAGIHPGALPVSLLTSKKLDDVFHANVSSAIILAKAFRQKGCHANGSSIVFLTSVSAVAGATGLSAYAASKAALLGLTKSLAIEFAPAGIRVNSVAPGFVRSEMTEKIKSALTQVQYDAIVALHPMGIGFPRDVANGIAFLLAETGRWVTGATLVIDGGYTAQ
jgi:NAD(P)-dependent dehydrogenase (short-subunit alcohol dehydrogenase family)